MVDELKRWQGDEAGRASWEKFMTDPAFERGVRVLLAQAVPIMVVGEPLENGAKRQYFQAGFHTAVHLMRNLHEIHFKKTQEQLPEWGPLEPEPDLEPDHERRST